MKPAAYVRYEVGVKPTFVPVINGRCEVSEPKLHEFVGLYTADQLREVEQQRDELLEALKDMDRAYMILLENGRDRILFLGGECDEVPVMESGDPYLRQARSAIAKVKP